MFSIAAAPARQSVGDTISVLSGRLSSASLLEDRRAAILGLRSFAKDYPASVASGALRSLIGSLSRDGEDVDTVKVVLETLLMLFSPNESSPEASDEIVLWLADEFTQRQENITLVLAFLETTDFYSRLYSLQLLSAILAARPERTEECVFTAPLGISRLVAVLDDRREAVRTEAVSLLVSLTPTSAEIQKLVAFESAFDRLFAIVAAEGGLVDGGRAIEDCLILLANLLRLNASNQALFRETGCIPHISKLLDGAVQLASATQEEVAPWAQAQRARNMYALLALLRLFLVAGAGGTPQNQMAFWQHGLLHRTLELAFSPSPPAQISIKAEALVVCADIIRGNAGLQESFARLQVPPPTSTPAKGSKGPQTNGVAKIFVIDGLLDLVLVVHSVDAFDMRMAACECLKAYFFHHDEVRLHFLRRAIDGHRAGVDETANVLTALLRPPPVQAGQADPYRYWFAAVIMFHLLFESPTAKALAMGVTEGDESHGEEVVTSIQTITAQLLACLGKGDDSRIAVGYLMLLIGWLFEDFDGVNDFLGEGSNVQGLVQAVLQIANGHVVVQGLCAMLLGVVYEFSTKDSAIPRATLQSILASRLGRDKYVDRLGRLRGHPLMRDFEVLPQKLDLTAGQRLPDVFFDATFVDFFRDNYSRLLRAIDRDPGLEISVNSNGVQKGISREMVDSLRAQLDEKTRGLQDSETTIASLERQLGQEQADHRRTKETGAVEMAKARSVGDNLRKRHEEELRSLQVTQERKEQEIQRRAEQSRKAAEQEVERVQRRAEAELADLRATISRLEVDLMKANKTRLQELQAIREEAGSRAAEQAALLKDSQERERQLETRMQEAKGRLKDLETRLQAAQDDAQKAWAAAEARDGEKAAVQGELDDLLMVFGDTEEKVAKYKSKLKELGEPVSDGEEDEEEEEEDDATSPNDVD